MALSAKLVARGGSEMERVLLPKISSIGVSSRAGGRSHSDQPCSRPSLLSEISDKLTMSRTCRLVVYGRIRFSPHIPYCDSVPA